MTSRPTGALLARDNGVLGGVLAGESFTLSQSYYFGGIEGKPPIKPIVIQGARIDLLDAFDGGAVYKHGGNQPEAPRKPAAAPDGVVESADDPDLIAEIREQIAGAIQRDGVGETPTGARAFALVTWLLKLRVGDKIIDPKRYRPSSPRNRVMWRTILSRTPSRRSATSGVRSRSSGCPSRTAAPTPSTKRPSGNLPGSDI